jgi:hypothetical protein
MIYDEGECVSECVNMDVGMCGGDIESKNKSSLPDE